MSQKSQKGRISAAQILEETTRRKTAPKSRPYRGAQQFGGVAQRTNNNVSKLSGRAREALSSRAAKRTKSA